MKILVAGGSGALGRRVVPLLKRCNHHIDGPTRRGVGPVRDLADTAQTVALAEVTRPDAIGDLVADLSAELCTVTLAVPTAGTAAPASASRRAWCRRPRPPGARLSPPSGTGTPARISAGPLRIRGRDGAWAECVRAVTPS